MALGRSLAHGLTAGVLVLACACNQSSSASDDAAGGSSSSGGVESFCTLDTRADPWSIGLQKTGARVTVRIADAAPAAPVRGDNRWVLEIEDPGGAPMDDMQIDTRPWMPDHNHGSPVPVVITAQGGGEYQVMPLNLYMAGYWTVTFDLTLPGDGGTDSVMFGVCVE